MAAGFSGGRGGLKGFLPRPYGRKDHTVGQPSPEFLVETVGYAEYSSVGAHALGRRNSASMPFHCRQSCDQATLDDLPLKSYRGPRNS